MAKIVIKVGSNLLVKPNGDIDKSYIIELSRTIAGLKKKGNSCILITSGAKAAGYGKAQKANCEEELYIKQALCAIGQVQLMKLYELAFDMYDEKVAQILINRDDFGHRQRFLNLRNTLIGLNEMGFIPIANENDTVATSEITFGDNDILAAMTAIGWKSDYLFLLSSVDGLMDDQDRLIKVFTKDVVLKKMEKTQWGSGGIETKIRAARAASAAGVRGCICNGRDLSAIERFLAGQNPGTGFEPSKKPASKKAWIGFLSHTKGEIIINNGAKRALMMKKSLLPVGIVDVKGSFEIGDVIDVRTVDGEKIGRGIVNFSSSQTRGIMGYQSSQLTQQLNRSGSTCIVHVDNFWLVPE
ncbi:MAG TPA: glutamate 5-kinase [Thermotogota bacterium]|nr:glutamate 5-kinase [Thermotogota bacterium]